MFKKSYNDSMDDREPRTAVGLDIGTDYIRVVVGSQNKDKINIIEAHQAPSKGVKRGIVSDVNQLAEAIDNAIIDVEQSAGVAIDKVTVNIDGANIISTEVDGMIGIASEQQLVTPDDIERIKDVAITGKISDNFHILDIIPRSYTIDVQTEVKNPLDMTGSRLEMKANVISVLKPDYNNLMQALLAAKLSPNLIISPIAPAELILNQKQRDNGVMIIDLGSATTGISIYEDGDLQHVSVLPIGSNSITNDLAIVLKIEPEIAEEIKKKYVNCQFKHQDKEVTYKHDGQTYKFNLAQVDEIVEARLDEIFDAITKQLKQIKYFGKLPNGAILVGGGSKLDNISQYIQDKLSLVTRLAKPNYDDYEGLVDKIKSPEYLTATSLMLESLHNYDHQASSKHNKSNSGKGFFGLFKK